MFARLNKPRTLGTIIIIMYLNQAMRPIRIHIKTVKQKAVVTLLTHLAHKSMQENSLGIIHNIIKTWQTKTK